MVSLKRSVFETSVGRLIVEGDYSAVTYLSWTEQDIFLDPEHKSLRELIETATASNDYSNVPIRLEGTEFQRAIWEAIRTVPVGETISYGELARRAGHPAAVRAAATACGKNKICLLVPCHRIVRQDGSVGKYRWGSALKSILLKREEK
jgi:O-6-methylguanine DNA methyltransferase